MPESASGALGASNFFHFLAHLLAVAHLDANRVNKADDAEDDDNDNDRRAVSWKHVNDSP